MSWMVLVAVGCPGSGVGDGAREVRRTSPGSCPRLSSSSALVLSMAGLAYAMRELPVGTAYAVWVGIGAVVDRRVRDDYR